MSNIKILVTGSKGFTGKYFSDYVTSIGHQVIPLKSNLLDFAAMKDEVKSYNFSHVAHFAAISFANHNDTKIYHEVNTVGTINLLESLKPKKHNIKKVLLISSANIYKPKSEGISEIDPVEPKNYYALSKYEMEQRSSLYNTIFPIIYARPFNYTGRNHDKKILIPKIIDHFIRKEKKIYLGNIDIEREFNDVRFVVQVYFELLNNGISNSTYNICTGKKYSIDFILNKISKITKHNIEVIQDRKLIRENDPKVFFGDPKKINFLTGKLQDYSIDKTLSWMAT